MQARTAGAAGLGLRRRRAGAMPVRAMVNFDLGPAQVLGMLIIAGSSFLYITRVRNPKISKDGDVVVSSIAILVGGILLFQVRPLADLATLRHRQLGIKRCSTRSYS